MNLQEIARNIPLHKADWDSYFFSVALMVGSRADCTRRQFGCIAVDPSKRIVATGYNSPPAGELSAVQRYFEDNVCRPPNGFPCCKKPGAPQNQSYDMCNAIHAEQNCLLQLGSHYDPVDLYVVGRDGQTGELLDAGMPCIMCSRFIKQANVENVHTLNADGTVATHDPAFFKTTT